MVELRDALVGAVIEGSGGVRYHLREIVGEGGQGWVYRANYDDPDGFAVVVKVLRPEGLQSESLQRFEREADVLRRLAAVPAPNPNIVRFYDYGVHKPPNSELRVPFIVLEYVEGQTLSRVVQAHGGFGLAVGRVRRLMKQVARALHTVHEQRIVHRDLKPSNILLTQSQGQEIAKVTDFGLVKLADLHANRTTTVAGASLGYAPPEQYEMGNNRVCPQTDVFSFAAVLFEVLSGAEAFAPRPNDSPLRMVARMLSDDRPQLAKVVATLPRELRERSELVAALDVEIARALSSDPMLRHGSIRELWEKVEPVLRSAESRGSLLPDELETTLAPSTGAPRGVTEWRTIGRAIANERLRGAVLSGTGRSVVAVGSRGLYHFSRGVWSPMQLPAGVDPRFVRSLVRAATGELLMFGDSGFALMLGQGGAVDRIGLGDTDLSLFGALADDHGVAFVGERMSRPVGVVVEVQRGKPAIVREIAGTSRLHGVARLSNGTLLVCGTHGALFEMLPGGPREVTWGRTGHLYAVAAAVDGGAYAVGSGGHALRLSPPRKLGAYDASARAQTPALDAPPQATLEAVQTTRDLTGVHIDDQGLPWAIGGQARLLQRRGNAWARVNLDPSVQGQLVGFSARRDGLAVVAEDGVVIESGPLVSGSMPPSLDPSALAKPSG